MPELSSAKDPVFDENEEDWASGGMVGENAVGEGLGEPLTRCWFVLTLVPSA